MDWNTQDYTPDKNKVLGNLTQNFDVKEPLLTMICKVLSHIYSTQEGFFDHSYCCNKQCSHYIQSCWRYLPA